MTMTVIMMMEIFFRYSPTYIEIVLRQKISTSAKNHLTRGRPWYLISVLPVKFVTHTE